MHVGLGVAADAVVAYRVSSCDLAEFDLGVVGGGIASARRQPPDRRFRANRTIADEKVFVRRLFGPLPGRWVSRGIFEWEIDLEEFLE